MVEAVLDKYAVDICLGYEVPGGGNPILVGHALYDDEDDGPGFVSPLEAKANARLWAAAPDLLAACEAAKANMEHFADNSEQDMRVLAVLEAAIAKAKGTP